MEENERIAMVIVDQEDASFESMDVTASEANSNEQSNTKKRIRRSREQLLVDKQEKLAKKIAEADALKAQIEQLKMSSEERKEYKKNLDTHCKLIAGTVALKLYENQSQNFDRDSFKNNVLASLTSFEDKEYFGKIFNE